MITLNPGSLCDVCAEEYGPHNYPHSIPCGEFQILCYRRVNFYNAMLCALQDTYYAFTAAITLSTKHLHVLRHPVLSAVYHSPPTPFV